jgi:hypothetical protein
MRLASTLELMRDDETNNKWQESDQNIESF